MNEGFVTFVNNSELYIKLTNVLVESVEKNTSKQIEVFSINFDYKHKSDRVISRRIDLNVVDYATICYTKLFSSFKSKFKFGIQLDGDMILTKDSEKLFEDCKRINHTPLGSQHPSDPNNQSELMRRMGVVEKTQPYVHATYLFSDSCKPFLEECFKQAYDLYKKGYIPPNFDETIYNVMLWKYKSKDFVDCYDPYFEYFLDRSQSSKNTHGYQNLDNVNFYICHGCKDPGIAKTILNTL